MNENILNSRLFKKIEDSDSFFSVTDLIKEIYESLLEERKRIISFLEKFDHDSEELKETIKVFNEIDSLPDVTIFGDIPNKYFDNLNNNIQSQIQLLNSVQKLQANWIKYQEINSAGKGKGKEDDEDDFNLNNFISKKGIGENE